MPPPRPSLLHAYFIRYSRLRTPNARSNGLLFIRNCSCSAQQAAPNTSSHSKPLNPTTPNPPTPSKDHREIAKSHDLFITNLYSPGSPLFLPNGAAIFNKLQAFLRAQYPQFGYSEVLTPTIYKKSLWKVSGHWDNYAEDMFEVKGRGASGETENAEAGQDEEFGLKPMNCPGHCLLFASQIRSYRDLPIRFADFSALHRNEISGALTGLTRVRRFHQDDAHIFCRPAQIMTEIRSALEFVGMVYDTFGLGPYKLVLSTRPADHFIGAVEDWDKAEDQLKAALDQSGREWSVNEGDGAFYGPKIDIILKDSNGKEHQTATIQLDFQLPQRFELQYQASSEEIKELEQSANEEVKTMAAGGLARPVIVHRAIYGSLERFMALLIEHYDGVFPFWLSPRPAIILALNDNPKVLEHVARLQRHLQGRSETTQVVRAQPIHSVFINVDTDISNRSLKKKIIEAKKLRYNHIIVVGPSEASEGNMNLQIASAPENIKASMVEVAESILGEKRYAEKGVRMTARQGREYFCALMEKYL